MFSFPQKYVLGGARVGVAIGEQRGIGVAHKFWIRFSRHHLQIDRLDAVVAITVDDARRTRDAIPRSQGDLDPPPVLLLEEHDESALQDEEHLLNFMSVRGVALAWSAEHNALGETARSAAVL